VPPGGVRIRLIFGAEADLDLYVTDPALETVYFGNNPSLGGGVLTRDLRCDAAAPRREVVTFRVAESGRYRVGVEYARGCARWSRSETAPYRIEVFSDESVWTAAGAVAPGGFDNIAFEFDLR
jgi:uncharacterized protein YfaP (DUF2135 family)